MEKFGLTVRAASGPGVMHQMTGVIAKHRGNISSIDITSEGAVDARIYFEIDMAEAPEALIAELRTLPVVHEVGLVKTLQAIYGKRIIIMGGGAQVGQVAIGAIIGGRPPQYSRRAHLGGYDSAGRRAAARRRGARGGPALPRVKALVLAGSLMGGDIEQAVREVRAQGLLVISLNMAGSVPDAADLVVSDPVQAGVMAVMAVADTAKFTVDLLKRRVF